MNYKFDRGMLENFEIIKIKFVLFKKAQFIYMQFVSYSNDLNLKFGLLAYKI